MKRSIPGDESPTAGGAAETPLITLYPRALETQRRDALVRDEQAIALLAQVRPELAWIDKVPLSETIRLLLILRNRELDRYTRDFLAGHPQAVVVHIGCGFDSRFERTDNGQVEWYDLDLPEVVEQRRKLIGDRGERHHLLGCSVLQSEWMDTVSVHRSRPFMFVAEGVLMYLQQAQVKWLVLEFCERFPGAELVFDACSPLHVWATNLQFARSGLGARLRWGVWRGQTIEGWGSGIRLLDQWSFFDRPEPRLAHIRWVRHIPLVASAAATYRFSLG